MRSFHSRLKCEFGFTCPIIYVHLFSGPANGHGPRTDVLTRAIQVLMSDGLYWTDCGNYKIIRLHPSLSPIPRRSSVFKAAGLLFLLRFLHVGAPIPVSPFFFSTLFDGRQTASRFDLDFLSRFISRDSLAHIKRFHSTPLDSPLYTEQTEECVPYQFLLNIAGIDVRSFLFPYIEPNINVPAYFDFWFSFSRGTRWSM